MDNIAFYLISSILFVITFKDFLTAYPFFLPLKIRGIDDLFTVCLFLLIIVHISFFRIKKENIKVILFLSVVILFSIIQSLLLKRSIFLNNPLFLIRDSLWFISVYYFISVADAQYLDRYKKIAFGFIWVQVIVFLIQQVYTIAVERTILFEDDVNGSLGANMSHVLSYTLVLFIPLLYKHRKLFLSLAGFLILMAASARSCLILTFFSLITVFSFRLKPSRSIPLVFIVLVCGAGVSYIYSNYTPTSLKLSNLLKQQNKSMDHGMIKGANRVAFLRYTIDQLNADKHLIFGYGIASYVSRTGTKVEGYKYKELVSKFQFNNMVASCSTYTVWLGELGISGTIIMVFFIVLFVVSAWKYPIVLGTLTAGFLGLVSEKLLESYAFGFFFWYMAALYKRESKLEQK